MKPDKIKRLSEDSYYPSFLSAEYANQIVDVINALLNLEAKGGKVIWSDAKVVIDVSGSSSPSTPTPNPDPPIIQDSTIYCLSRWQ